MEYILVALFGGGVLDWEDVGKTNFCWEDIIDLMKDRLCKDVGNFGINDFYWAVLVCALEKLEDKVNNFIEENNSTEDVDIKKDIEILSNMNILSDFEIYCNCLDTNCYFVGSNDLRQVLLKYFEEDIDKISEDIGFTYLCMDE